MSYTDREILELLESGKMPSDVARAFGIKPKTMSAKTARYRQRGILTKDNRTVNWSTFEEWERTKGKSKPLVYSKRARIEKTALGKGKPMVYLESKLESLLPKLEEIIAWWDQRKNALSKPLVSPTKRQTYILSEALIENIKNYAKHRAITITEAANEIIRKGLAE